MAAMRKVSLRDSLPLVLVVMGLILISAAAFVIALALGLFTAGAGCFLLEWHLEAERRRQ